MELELQILLVTVSGLLTFAIILTEIYKKAKEDYKESAIKYYMEKEEKEDN